jgi:hypothetical protein
MFLEQQQMYQLVTTFIFKPANICHTMNAIASASRGSTVVKTLDFLGQSYKELYAHS